MYRGETYYPRSEYKSTRCYQGQVKAVIFDWAGTVVDCGVLAPALTFCELFKNEGVCITEEEARGPMGTHKRVHIKKILENASVQQQWVKVHGKTVTEEDIDRMYKEFSPTILSCLHKYSNIIDGVVDTVKELRRAYGIKIGSTTGFPKEILQTLLRISESQGYVPEANVAADEVPEARPCPYMVWTCAMRLGVHPIEAVIKVDDTVDGIREGLSAGCWTIAVAKTSNYMGLTEQQLDDLSQLELKQKLGHAYEILINSGAHYVVNTVVELPLVIKDINRRLAGGEKP
ncbi:phosphonoacetaldehyde hydrolase-like isoform X2 [Tachypleus tridentatus]|uniref:phosphonoacetaldehyde hydrolase-like isoform X2 n=1 Tax=Tachypleus tridentatus TaxID=6853 RepID=UPI003FD55858